LLRYKEGYVTDIARKERERLAACTDKPAIVTIPTTDTAKVFEFAFTPDDRERVARNATRNGLPLPEYSFEDSGRATPNAMKKFVGVFASRVGFDGGPVQAMIIVTD
jgi:hypothetical protein